MTNRYSRRRFLRQAAATIGAAVGVAGRKALPISAEEPPPARRVSVRESVRPAALQEHPVFLPYVSGGPLLKSVSKLGVHTIRPDGAMGFIRQVRDAGSYVALVKALDDLGYLQEVQAYSPETVRVARRHIPDYSGIDAQGDPVAKAQAYMSQHMSLWGPDREVVQYWEVLNEADPPGTDGHAWLGDFHIACMDIADANGYTLALFSYSVGVPEWEEWEAIVETGVFERAKQSGHILSLHEYSWPNIDRWWGEPLPGHTAGLDRGVLAGRYRHLYEDFLIPKNQVIPLAVTEAGYDPSIFPTEPGWGDSDWKSRYVSEMAWYDGKLREDDYVLGCALFTLGPVDPWHSWDYEDLLPDLAAYIISMKDAP